jgi:tRNA threonylcarbamoyladenosine biosynthesis protein TsaB
MNMLAVSTSAKHPSAALYLEKSGEAEPNCRGVILFKRDESGKPHSVSLGALVDEVLSEAGLSVSDIDAFAVDIGPGSFMGVRIGVSFVNALAYSENKPVFAVPSLAALRNLAPCESKVLVMLDARNSNGYAAAYENGECILEPCACVQSEVRERFIDAELIGDAFDPETECDAALVIIEALSSAEYAVSSAVPLYLRPSQAERMRKSE